MIAAGTIVQFVMGFPHVRKLMFGVGLLLGLGLMYLHAYNNGVDAERARHQLAQANAQIKTLKADIAIAERTAREDAKLREQQETVVQKVDSEAEEVIKHVPIDKGHRYGLSPDTSERLRSYLRASEKALATRP